MLTVNVNRVKPGKEAALHSWFEEMTGRRDEVVDTLREQSVRHVQAFIVRTSDGPLLFLASEVEDMVLARKAFLASTGAIDADFKRVMSEVLEGTLMTCRSTNALLMVPRPPNKPLQTNATWRHG